MRKARTILGVAVTIAAVALLAIVGLATAGSAHTGSTFAQQTCNGWQATVSLDNNVTADRTVTITSTIPGTPASTVLHQDTTKNPGPVVVWEYDGAENNLTGTVTLVITPDTFGDHSSIVPAEGCTPPPTCETDASLCPPPPPPAPTCATDASLSPPPVTPPTATPPAPPVAPPPAPVCTAEQTAQGLVDNGGHCELPNTGSDTWKPVALALVLLGGGIALLRARHAKATRGINESVR